MPNDTYLELREHIGVNAHGNPEPLVEIGVVLNVPVMHGKEVVEISERHVIRAAKTLRAPLRARIIDGTRIVHTDDPAISEALLGTGNFTQIDKPTSKQQAESAKDTQDARDEAGTIATEEEAA